MNSSLAGFAHLFAQLRTPFYFYDTDLLRQTLTEAICRCTNMGNRSDKNKLHYAVKACTHPSVLAMVKDLHMGADCVSGGEIQTCLDAGIPASQIVYAGVGKSDWEIELALKAGIEYFNVESVEELEVMSDIAHNLCTTARVCLRINPNVGAHTHAHITTGLSANKFGIGMEQMETAIRRAHQLRNIEWMGLHFHIGSQITDMDDFVQLCHRINELQQRLEQQGIAQPKVINVGGGLGVDYEQPGEHPIPDFKAYFQTFATHLQLSPEQELHFELGRSLVAQCGNLITRCLYVKHTDYKDFVIVDAGMNDLMRPALYGAYHSIENISSPQGPLHTYDVVGPICESSDVFGTARSLPLTKRGHLLAIRSAGAYGQSMASQYNCRPLPESCTKEVLSEEILYRSSAHRKE